VFFGSHRRAQAVLVPIATWEKLLAHAEDALDLDVARERLADDRPWLSEDELDAALQRAAEVASRQKSARTVPARKHGIGPVKARAGKRDLPLIGLTKDALGIRQQQQTVDRAKLGNAWADTGLSSLLARAGRSSRVTWYAP
jgi:hypothetical protein